MDAKVKGIALGIAWFVIVGGLACLSSLMMIFMHSGGVSSPGPLWGAVLAASAFGTPPIMALAGLPLAYQVYRERPVLITLLISLAIVFLIFVTSWVVPIVVRGS